jgi:uncharacterized membrane protein
LQQLARLKNFLENERISMSDWIKERTSSVEQDTIELITVYLAVLAVILLLLALLILILFVFCALYMSSTTVSSSSSSPPLS